MRTLRPLLLMVLLATLVGAAPARAESDIANRLRVFLDAQVLPGGGEVEVTVGDPDPRLNLAPCERMEPFVPSGARLWGRTSLGVRCLDGARWTVYLPTTIKVFAPGLVAARPIARGEPLGPDDVRAERLELTALPPGLIGGVDAIDGKTAARAIAAGEAIRRDLLRAPQVLQAGDPVRVLAGGAGFSVITEGKALTAATDGQTAQVAVAGKVLTGVARAGKVVEVR